MPPHRPDAYARYRARKIETQRAQAKVNKTLLCDVPSCANRREWRFQYCEHHRQRQKRLGHPEARFLYHKDLQPFVTEVERLRRSTPHWPGWSAAERTLAAILRDPTQTRMIGPKQDFLWRALHDRDAALRNLPKERRAKKLRTVLYRLVAVWCLDHFGYRELPRSDLAMFRQLGAQALALLPRTRKRQEGSVGRSRELAGRILVKYLGQFLKAVTAELERRHIERQRASLRQADARAST